jgi:uncharacterized protein (UPF0332 family)
MASRKQAWSDLSLECFKSAQLLKNNEKYRSSINRSYYAAYAAVTSNIPEGTVFPFSMTNPSHQQVRDLLPGMIKASVNSKKRIVKALNFLWYSRIDADYRPYRNVGAKAAIDCIHYASFICQRFEVI